MNRLFLGNTKIQLSVTDSTNFFAHQLINNQSAVDGTIVIADYQTGGKGQSGNSWISDHGKNLLCSYILFPKALLTHEQFMLTQMVSLAVTDFLKEFITDKNTIKIKWPNDIFVNQQKIAGILIENNIRGNKITSSVLGIGLNINQESFGELSATSIKCLIGKNENILKCADLLSEKLEARYFQLFTKKHKVLYTEYLMQLYRWKESANYIIDGVSKKAKIVDVDPIGRLGVMFEQENTICYFSLKEIVFEH